MRDRLEKYKGRKDIPPFWLFVSPFLIIGDNLISSKKMDIEYWAIPLLIHCCHQQRIVLEIFHIFV